MPTFPTPAKAGTGTSPLVSLARDGVGVALGTLDLPGAASRAYRRFRALYRHVARQVLAGGSIGHWHPNVTADSVKLTCHDATRKDRRPCDGNGLIHASAGS